jgi:hypothetical protein
LSQLDQINADPKENWYSLALKKIITNLYMAQSVKVQLNEGETRSVKIVRRVRHGCCLSPILFNYYSKCLTKEALEGFGDFKIGGQIIHSVKYADDLPWLRKERCYRT